MWPRSSSLVLFAGALMFASAGRGQTLAPEALPDPRIPNFRFPESEATLTRWVTEAGRGIAAETRETATVNLLRHGWGLWTALTAEGMQFAEGQRLRVFETWQTVDELAPMAVGKAAAFVEARPVRRSTLGNLEHLQRPWARAQLDEEPPAESQIDRIAGFTKFDPTAAAHITTQRLLETDTLEALLVGGAQGITPFPATALAVKPVFQIIRRADLVDGRYYALKAWSGPPAAPQAYPPSAWPGAVWIDVRGGGADAGEVELPHVADGSARTAATTYPLATLIHYRLSALDAAALNAVKPASEAAVGDIAILVAMHVSSRETARWTWQTFWWTPAPEAPPEPSSPRIASLRPAQLRGAPRHYAMALAYTMLAPSEPYVGGANDAPVAYVYNPYVEARFAPSDLPDSLPGVDPAGRPAANNTGVQSNCMSCHIQATYNPQRLVTAPRFAGARYVDLGAAAFVGTLQTDFLWAIPRHAK